MSGLRFMSQDVHLLVSVVPVPLLVADYTPIIDRFQGMAGGEVRELLLNDAALLNETLRLPLAVAASPEWVRLYGSPLSAEAPDLTDRHFSPEEYPELHRSLIDQFTAPFFGTTTLVNEHTAPTLLGDVTVRSHWRVIVDDGVPAWDRVVIVDLDITDLRRSRAKLEEHLERQQRLVSSVSHEIRTPLASIVGFAGLLHDSSDLTNDERQELLEILVQQSSDITDIVDDLLVEAKSDAGQLEVSSVGVDLRAQAAQAIESMDFEMRKLIPAPVTPVHCIGDPARVRQIARNLVSNAKKHGGPNIQVRTDKQPGAGLLIVSDDGPAIPEEQREGIFSPYVQYSQGSSDVPSLGLGLHICRTLAWKMNGDLTYRYLSGRSEFVLRLPLRPDASEEQQAPSE
ncbi:MAG: HAMP domain-containing sensor histidine kinase [Acidimicrobiia bacterium]